MKFVENLLNSGLFSSFIYYYMFAREPIVGGKDKGWSITGGLLDEINHRRRKVQGLWAGRRYQYQKYILFGSQCKY